MDPVAFVEATCILVQLLDKGLAEDEDRSNAG